MDELPKFDMTGVKILATDMKSNPDLYARINYPDGCVHIFSVIGFAMIELNGKVELGAFIVYGVMGELVIAQTIEGFDGFYNLNDDHDDDDDQNSDEDYPFDPGFPKVDHGFYWLN